MQTPPLEVCSMAIFGGKQGLFWMNDLLDLLEMYPVFEHPHRQDFFMLLFITKAQGNASIDQINVQFEDSQVVIIKPRCISNFLINRKAEGKVICFHEDFFSLRYNNNKLSHFNVLQIESKPHVRLTEAQKKKLDLLIELLSEEYILDKNESDKVLRSYLNILLFELDRAYNPTGFQQVRNLKLEKIKQFEVLIDQHFEKLKLPSDYAVRLHISPNYLNKICKEETGFTAGEIIRKRIILEAQRLLTYTTLSINQIADKLGFENASYFVTFFRRQTSKTPEKFRKE